MGKAKSEVEYTYLYNGAVTLAFNHGSHRYTVNGVFVPSVTGITNVSGKEALTYWAANMAAQYVEENLKVGEIIDEVQKLNLIEGAKTAHTIKKKQAATIGTTVHDWIEEYIKFKIAYPKDPVDMRFPINEMARNGVISFLTWVKDNDVIFQASERRVYSREFNFAGTLDVKCVIRDVPCIGDFKTSTGIWKEHIMQAAAYEACENEETNQELDITIIHIPKDGGVLKVLDIDRTTKKAAFKAFLGCKALYENQYGIDKLCKSFNEDKAAQIIPKPVEQLDLDLTE